MERVVLLLLAAALLASAVHVPESVSRIRYVTKIEPEPGAYFIVVIYV
jgi:hypothetical protein